MRIEGEYAFQAPPDVVWKAILDPEVLAAVLPGCEKLELVAENEYEGDLSIKIGPVQGKFSGKVRLEDIRAGESYTMQVDGRGAAGFVKATATVALRPDGDGTILAYGSDAQVGGRIASVGQRLVETSAKAVVKQSLESLAAITTARTGAPADNGETAEAPPLPQGPSQSDFAAAVAKQVARDLLPPAARWGLGAAALAIAAILYIVLT